jgi:hypothetical protein
MFSDCDSELGQLRFRGNRIGFSRRTCDDVNRSIKKRVLYWHCSTSTRRCNTANAESPHLARCWACFIHHRFLQRMLLRFILTLSFHFFLRQPKKICPEKFYMQFLPSPSTCRAHFNHSDLNTVTTVSGLYTSRKFSLCNTKRVDFIYHGVQIFLWLLFLHISIHPDRVLGQWSLAPPPPSYSAAVAKRRCPVVMHSCFEFERHGLGNSSRSLAALLPEIFCDSP